MPTITFDSKDFTCHPGESILDCLTRQGIQLPSSCRAGVCQTCLMHCHDGEIPAEAQKGLKDTYQAQDYFLACICKPRHNMTVGLLPDIQQWHPVKILETHKLVTGIFRLRMQIPEGFTYHAGQFINLKSPKNAVRSYSIASLPDEGFIELHIKCIPNGQVSTWLCNEINPGDTIEINGPIGQCFYIADTPPNNEKKLLLAGTGTGLAPLYGILKSALQQGHTQPIHLFHGSITRETLYLVKALQQLSAKYKIFRYTPCILQGKPYENEKQGNLTDIIKTTYPSLKGWKTYLCGDPQLVKQLRMQCFINGVSMADIYADPFELAQK